MSDPAMVKAIKEAVTIPVMAKARIGHFVEAQILEALGVDYVDESEVYYSTHAMYNCFRDRGFGTWQTLYSVAHLRVAFYSVCHRSQMQVLTPADETHHINKHNFKVPFVCGCRDLGEALRRVAEGASMIRTKGEAGTGNVVEAVRHCRAVQGAIR